MDAVKHTFALTGHLLPQTIDRLTQSVIVTSTGASNRIEGNLLSDNDVEADQFEYLLSKKTFLDVSKDVLEALQSIKRL